jgi:hypothetical protein
MLEILILFIALFIFVDFLSSWFFRRSQEKMANEIFTEAVAITASFL